MISAINSLTLSPALAARLLRPHGAPRDLLTRVIDLLFGWFFRRFDRGFRRSGARLRGARSASPCAGAAPRSPSTRVTIALAVVHVPKVPGGFVPTQDKMYLIGIVSLPPGASLDRTEAVVREITERALAHRRRRARDRVPRPQRRALHEHAERRRRVPHADAVDERERTAAADRRRAQRQVRRDPGGLRVRDHAAAVLGLGTGAGFSLYVEDRAGRGDAELAAAIGALQGTVAKTPGMLPPFSTYQPNVPQLELAIDRTKAKAQGIALTDLFETLQIYLGSAYVNDFSRFGRTYQVIAQADAPFRERVEQIGELRTRNARRRSSCRSAASSRSSTTFGPDPVVRYNGFPAADLVGAGRSARSCRRSEAIAAVAATRAATCCRPASTYEWTDLSFQQVSEGGANLSCSRSRSCSCSSCSRRSTRAGCCRSRSC